MDAQQTLAFESRTRPRQLVVAAAAGVLIMVAAIIGIVGPHAAANEATLSLIVQHRRATLVVVAAIVNAVAEIAIAATLVYLWRCASARGETKWPVVPFIVGLGALLGVIGGVVYAVELVVKANEFVTTGAQTYDEATRITGGALLEILQIAAQLGALLIAVSYVLVSIMCMRVGLLPRFLAYVGIFAGVLTIIPIIAVPIVQLYWLIAVAILLSGSWPSGLPPAWTTGRAEPWPSSAEMRARRTTEMQEARDKRDARKRGAHRERVPDTAGAADAGTDASAGQTRATTPKRKRKRRH